NSPCSSYLLIAVSFSCAPAPVTQVMIPGSPHAGEEVGCDHFPHGFTTLLTGTLASLLRNAHHSLPIEAMCMSTLPFILSTGCDWRAPKEPGDQKHGDSSGQVAALRTRILLSVCKWAIHMLGRHANGKPKFSEERPSDQDLEKLRRFILPPMSLLGVEGTVL
ncbi:hypothetical protein STEG23_005005, partial [Scotinomys teguina]